MALVHFVGCFQFISDSGCLLMFALEHRNRLKVSLALKASLLFVVDLLIYDDVHL